VHRRLAPRDDPLADHGGSPRRPQPRPAWFHWDGRTVPVSDEPDAATILRGPPSAARVRADLGKDRLGLRDPEMSAERFRAQR
jgi:hypothetical protein